MEKMKAKAWGGVRTLEACMVSRCASHRFIASVQHSSGHMRTLRLADNLLVTKTLPGS